MRIKSTKTKLQTTIFNFIVALVIAGISFLPYLHDFEIFKGQEGFSGFSSLRVGIWVISLFIIAICGWAFAFLGHKGKQYRFVMLAPIIMLIFQLMIYVLDSRKTFVNDLNLKVILNFIVLGIIIIIYFKLKKNNG